MMPAPDQVKKEVKALHNERVGVARCGQDGTVTLYLASLVNPVIPNVLLDRKGVRRLRKALKKACHANR